jgi:hypothetical protein
MIGRGMNPENRISSIPLPIIPLPPFWRFKSAASNHNCIGCFFGNFFRAIQPRIIPPGS